MSGRFYEFDNMDLYSCHDLDLLNNASPGARKLEDLTSIGANAFDDEVEPFYQKSSKDLTAGYEISFEKGFMNEHQMVFEKNLQNLMESFGISKNKSPAEVNLDSFPSPRPLTSIKQVARNSSLGWSSERIDFFLEKLQDFEKLEEFLDIVVNQTEEYMLNELIELVEKLVEKYDSIKMSEPSDLELLQVASEVAKGVKLERLTTVNGVGCLQSCDVLEVKENAKRFVEVYCATTMLVIAQYFVNPYSDNESGCFKRAFSPFSFQASEEEQNFEPSLTKKRKLSF